MPADFSVQDKFDREKAYLRILFGDDAYLLETELNEMQKILTDRIVTLIKALVSNGFVNRPELSLEGSYLTLPADVFTIDGELHEILDPMTIFVTNGDTIYLSVWEKTVNYQSEIRRGGNLSGGDIIEDNGIYDERVDEETSRRIQLQLQLVKDMSDPSKKYLPIASINDGVVTDLRPVAKLGLPLKDGIVTREAIANGAINHEKLSVTVLPSESDLDDALSPGFYRLSDNHESVPYNSNVDFGQMIVSRGLGTILQILTGFLENEFYMRNGNPDAPGGSYNPWARLWHDKNHGAGSGLDADILRGMQPSTSATANTIVQRDPSGRIKACAPSASDDVARKAEVDQMLPRDGSAPMTGNLFWSNWANISTNSAGWMMISDNAYLHPTAGSMHYRKNHDSLGARGVIIDWSQSPEKQLSVFAKIGVTTVADQEFTLTWGVDRFPIWHEGNDGPGSGLDADMVRGLLPSTAATGNTIVQRDPNGRFKAGAPSASDDVARKAETDAALTAAQNAQATANAALPKSGGIISGDLTVNGALRTRNSANAIYVGDDAIIEDFDRANTIRIKGQQNPAAGDIFVSTNNWKVWHSGNDGAGSGLDADTVDGLHGSQIVRNGSAGNHVIFARWFGDAIRFDVDITQDLPVAWAREASSLRNFPIESGIWTPDLQFDGSNPGITYYYRSGRYTRIHNVVYFSASIQLTARGSGYGTARIAGLPFIPSGALPYPAGAMNTANVTHPVNSFGLRWMISGGMPWIELLSNDSYSIVYLNQNNFQNNARIDIEGFYYI